MVFVIAAEPDGLADDSVYAGIGAALVRVEVLVLDPARDARLGGPVVEPLFKAVFPARWELRQLFFGPGDLLRGIRDLSLVGVGSVKERGGRYRAGEIGVEPKLVNVVEEGEEFVVLLLGDRVVFVIVASCTFEGQAEERRGEGMGPVRDLLDPEFFRGAAAFHLL